MGRNNKDDGQELLLTSGDDTEAVANTKKNPGDAIRQLGVWVSPLGNMEEQSKVLVQRANKWANKIKSSGLTPTEIYIAVTMGVEKSIGYPLPATRLSAGQCGAIYRPIRQTILHAHHTTSKFPNGSSSKKEIIGAPGRVSKARSIKRGVFDKYPLQCNPKTGTIFP